MGFRVLGLYKLYKGLRPEFWGGFWGGVGRVLLFAFANLANFVLGGVGSFGTAEGAFRGLLVTVGAWGLAVRSGSMAGVYLVGL